MGGMLSQPVTDKRSNHGEGLGLKYGLCSMQGWRSEMEDAHDIHIGLKYGLDDWCYFAVFDGHAGKRAAAFAAWNLLEFILRDSEFKLATGHLPTYVCIEPDEEKLNGLSAVSKRDDESENRTDSGANIADSSDTTMKSDQKSELDPSSTQKIIDKSTASASESGSEMKKNIKSTTATQSAKSVDPLAKPEFVNLPVLEQLKTVENAIKSGFLRIDQSMRDGACDMSGCTAVCTFISPTHLFIANCGDSRAVLYDGVGTKFATIDHKPVNPKERDRIVCAGGIATQRINGTLAVSRALGDFEFKKDTHRGPCEQLVSPEPEVTVIQRNPKDEFLILACDGIWDVMENYVLCEYIHYKLKIEPNLEKVCSSVLDVCLQRGSRDNMSIIIVVFENGPKFSEENLARERENDEALAKFVREHGERHDDFNEFLYRLKRRMEKFGSTLKVCDYLPAGVGIHAKYDMLHEIFEKEFEDKSELRSDDE